MTSSRLPEAPAALPGREGTPCSGLRILVVEDNADSALSQAIILRLSGHEVEVAHDGPMALALAKKQAPDVVLLDIGLPGIDGWAVAKLLKEQAPAEKSPFFIAITGFGQKQDIRHSREIGIDLHLLKPVDPQYLSSILRRFQNVIR